MQVRVVGAVRGSQLDIKGGIFLLVCSPDPSNYRKAVRLLYVVGNVSQNYLSCSCLQALSVVGQDFPRIGAATFSNPGPFLPGTQALRNALQAQCRSLRLPLARPEDTKYDAVLLRRVTLRLPRQNPWAPNQGYSSLPCNRGEYPQTQSLPDRQVQSISLQCLRDTASANDEGDPPSSSTSLLRSKYDTHIGCHYKKR